MLETSFKLILLLKGQIIEQIWQPLLFKKETPKSEAILKPEPTFLLPGSHSPFFTKLYFEQETHLATKEKVPFVKSHFYTISVYLQVLQVYYSASQVGARSEETKI